MKKITFIISLSLMILLTGCNPEKKEAASNKEFSFVAFGDSRPLMYMPYTKSQEATIREYLFDMFDLGGFEEAEEIAQKVPLTYDENTGMLTAINMPYVANSKMVISFDNGWVTESSIITADGKKHTSYRSSGGAWVAWDVADKISSGQAAFVIHSGDIVWWGKQGQELKDSPYWQKVNRDLLSKLPEPTEEMKKANIYGRYFPAIGNHEVWGDPDGVGVRSTLPWLAKLGVTKDNFIYKFDYRNSRFISLFTGPYDYNNPSEWEGNKPAPESQRNTLKNWLDEAKADPKITHVFISLHNPVFASSSEFGGMPEDMSPHKLISSYAKDLDITVFNGHIHTTEIRKVDGVRYLLLGGGGGEQVYEDNKDLPADYPKELYWQGNQRVEEYNYVEVTIKNDTTTFILNRYRPETAFPFESIELYQETN